MASQVFSRRTLTLNFFKTPIDPTTFDFIGSEVTPDITMEFEDNGDETQAIYDLENKEIKFFGEGILSKPETWESSGQIVSLLDLPGSQLIVQLEYDKAVTSLKKLPVRGFNLQRINLPKSIYLVMNIADRRDLTIPEEEQKLYKGPNGTTNFVYLFPKTYEETQHLFER